MTQAEVLSTSSPQLRGLSTDWPRITLVTAVRNGAKYLDATIQSVMNQRYPNLEYFVIDGGSTDGSVEIIRWYREHVSAWVSEPDSGLYDALNKGFARATGEILGWLNASDLLQANGLFVVGSVFGQCPEVEWLTGRPTYFNASGMTIEVLPLPRWSRSRFLAGANRHIQQESTFWRKSLWEKAGAKLSTSYGAAGDFELWTRFFRHARLYSVDALIGGYRYHSGALGVGAINDYHRNCERAIENELESAPWRKTLKAFRAGDRAIRRVPKVRGIWRCLIPNALYRLPGPDLPPRIVNRGESWTICK